MSKVFNINGTNVSIDDTIFNEACNVYVLEDESNLVVSDTVEECRRNNYLNIINLIEAGFTKTLDALGTIDFEYIVKTYTIDEINIVLDKMLRKDIQERGGIAVSKKKKTTLKRLTRLPEK